MYLGPALNTPGGHLVLVDKDGSSKVLLTNTVYPVRKGTLSEPTKPRRRLTGKRSSFEIRVAAAAVLETVCGEAEGTRFPPGGESFGVSGFFVDFSEPGEGLAGEEFDFSSCGPEKPDTPNISEEVSLSSCVERRVWVEGDSIRVLVERNLLLSKFDDTSCLELLVNGPVELLSATRPIARGKGQAVLYAVRGRRFPWNFQGY